MTEPNLEVEAGWRRRARSLALGAAAIVAVDQIVKLVVTAHLGVGRSIPLVPGLVHLTLVRNTGMAFGLLSGSDIPYKSLVVTVASILAMGAVSFYALGSPSGEMRTRLGLTFILGGAIGNIIDRARLGFVIDFVDVFYRDAHWPAFNVADASICIGVGLLLLDSLTRREPSPVAAEAEVAAHPGRGDS